MIGDNIRSLRNSRNYTLEELSNELNSKYPNTLNFNKGKISKWENNKEEPKLSSVRILADFFEVTVDDLVHGKYDRSILPIYNQLDNLRQKKVYTFAKKQLEEQTAINKKDDILIAAHKDENLTDEQEKEVSDYIQKLIDEQNI